MTRLATAGGPLRDARAGLNAIASALQERSDGLVDLIRRSPVARLPRPRLLGSFDPVLLGWRSREPVVGSHRHLVTVNGIFRPFALVHGRAVACWTLSDGAVVLKPFAELAPRDLATLADDATDVVRYLGIRSRSSMTVASQA